MSRPVPQRWSPGEIKRLRELRDGAQLPGMITGALATIDALEAQVAALTAERELAPGFVGPVSEETVPFRDTEEIARQQAMAAETAHANEAHTAHCWSGLAWGSGECGRSHAQSVTAEREACARVVERMADAADKAGGLASPKQHRLREAADAIRARWPVIDCEWELRPDDEDDCGCIAHEPCWKCGGVGYFDLHDEDPLAYDPDETQVCDECHGVGSYRIHVCGGENRGGQ